MPFGFKITEDRNFEVSIYEKDFKELCAWVLKCEHIETGGDLFGLWVDKYTAAIQLVLGPGKQCRRTSVSFYQDVPYLERVGSYLTQHEGLCHIGEWHSHHRLGLARPSGGDERTVWSNMPTYNLSRFIIFIGNIESSRKSESKVNIGCFLFEIESKSGKERPVLQGKFNILPGVNPLVAKPDVLSTVCKGAESRNTETDLNQLILSEDRNGRSYVPCTAVNNLRQKEETQRSKKTTAANNGEGEARTHLDEGEELQKKRKQEDQDESKEISQKLAEINLEAQATSVSTAKKHKTSANTGGNEEDPQAEGSGTKNNPEDARKEAILNDKEQNTSAKTQPQQEQTSIKQENPPITQQTTTTKKPGKAVKIEARQGTTAKSVKKKKQKSKKGKSK